MLTPNELLTIGGQLILAIILGALIGLERELAKKSAGMRTYALVCLGSAAFTIIPQIISARTGDYSFNPISILSQIIVGIGFLGAGVIIFQKSHVSGITTAASLWVAAAVGACVGFKIYDLAILLTLLVLFVLIIFWSVEKKLLHKDPLDQKQEDDIR